MKQLLVAPTHSIARSYLRRENLNPEEWITMGLDEDYEWLNKLRGRRGMVGRIIDNVVYENADRKDEFNQMVKISEIKLTPVSY